jgi:hypothetical protein
LTRWEWDQTDDDVAATIDFIRLSGGITLPATTR